MDTTRTSLLDRHDPDFAGPTDTWTFHLDGLGHSELKLDRPALNSLILRKRTIAQPRSTSLTIADPGNDSNSSGPLSLATFIAKRNDRRHSTQQTLTSAHHSPQKSPTYTHSPNTRVPRYPTIFIRIPCKTSHLHRYSAVYSRYSRAGVSECKLYGCTPA